MNYKYSIGDIVNGVEITKCFTIEQKYNDTQTHTQRTKQVKCYQYKCLTCKKEHEMREHNFLKAKKLCSNCYPKNYNRKTDFKYKVGERFNEVEIIDAQKKDRVFGDSSRCTQRSIKEKYYQLKCVNCGYTHWIAEANLDDKTHCVSCNDIRYFNPEYIKNKIYQKNNQIEVLNIEDYTNNTTKLSFKCKVCGNTFTSTVSSICSGHQCHFCSTQSRVRKRKKLLKVLKKI